MAEKFTHWNPSDNLKTEADMALYLNACLDEDSGNGALVCLALKDIAHVKGMAQLAMDSGIPREELYKALAADGTLELSAVLKVVGIGAGTPRSACQSEDGNSQAPRRSVGNNCIKRPTTASSSCMRGPSGFQRDASWINE